MTGENEYVEVDTMPSHDNEIHEFRLPPLPSGLRPWDDKTDARYQGDASDYRRRICHKLYQAWVLWAIMRTSKPLEDILAIECDKRSDEYECKCVIVDLMDRLGKLLGDTNVLEEIAWLTNEEEFNLQQALLKEKQESPEKPPDASPAPATPKTSKPSRSHRKKVPATTPSMHSALPAPSSQH